MGLFDMFKKGGTIPKTASFRITEQGKEKLQEFDGGSDARLLVALETRGTSNIQGISAASGLSMGSVERLIPPLVKGGYIQYVNASTMVEA